MRAICDEMSIPFYILDLNNPINSQNNIHGSFDIILLCEVLEHISRWPVDVLSELKNCLNSKGLILLTTPNLVRLSNRLRMLSGKRLFAHFERDDLTWGHVREYTPEEVVFLLKKAGFQNINWKLVSFPDTRKPKALSIAYRAICSIIPTLKNYIFCWAYVDEKL